MFLDKSEVTVPSFFATIIIVNFNAGKFLQPALDALTHQSCEDFEIILVDNASTDGSVDELDTCALKNFSLIRLEENIGFAAGNNYAAKLAKGAWLALLNPDTVAEVDWLESYKAATEDLPDVRAFCGPTINMSNPELMDGAGDCYFALGLPWRGGYLRPISELPEMGECFSPCGASMLVRRDQFLEMGGFYERLFCYCEDVDLGFRLRLEGQICVFWPSARVAHYGGGTSPSSSQFSVRMGARNRFWVFVRDMPLLALIVLLLPHLALTFALMVRAATAGRAGPTIMGLWEAVKGLGPVLKERRSVQARRTIGTLAILRDMSWKWRLLRHRKTDIRPLQPRN